MFPSSWGAFLLHDTVNPCKVITATRKHATSVGAISFDFESGTSLMVHRSEKNIELFLYETVNGILC